MQNLESQKRLIAERIVYFREQNQINQSEMADKMGFNNRQTLSDIERGERAVTSDELVRFANEFGVQPMDLLDAYVPATKVQFSWRTNNEAEAWDRFELRGKSILNLLSTLRTKLDVEPITVASLPLGERNSIEDAEKAAIKLIDEYELGAQPARNLSKLYDALNLDCIYLELPNVVSGATMVSDQAIIAVVNANQVRGRRNFDKAHELFHCLTWRTMPPKHIDLVRESAGVKKSRVELLADAFAAALLVPAGALREAIAADACPADVMSVADDFEVSYETIVWRMTAIALIDKPTAKKLLKSPHEPGNGNPENLKPHALMSQTSLNLIASGIDSGLISVRRVAELLGLSIERLASAFEENGLTAPFDI